MDVGLGGGVVDLAGAGELVDSCDLVVHARVAGDVLEIHVGSVTPLGQAPRQVLADRPGTQRLDPQACR